MRLIPFARQFALLWIAAMATLISAGSSAIAAPKLVGVVIDYSPRGKISGKAAIAIKREGKLYPVREQEIIYEGDSFVFDPAGGAGAFVRALVDARNEVRFDPHNVQVPSQRWPFLQTLFPKLLTAYRWVNDTTSSEEAGPLNAISRGDDETKLLEVLPNYRGKLFISDIGKEPLWIGWKGGTPPFTLIAQSPGKTVVKSVVCDGVAEEKCVREGTLDLGGDAGEAVQVTINSSDGSSWTRSITRKSVTSPTDVADAAQLGDLGTFLLATELLDRGHGEFVLESARKLEAISKSYPPARVLLDMIRDGHVP
jgi:hypothetical protein